MKNINNQKYSTTQFKGFRTKVRCGFNHNHGYHYTDVYTTETDRSEIRKVFSSKHFSEECNINIHITQFLTAEELKYGEDIIGNVIDSCLVVESMWPDD